MERIHVIIGNLVQAYNTKDTYIDNDNPWLGILAPIAFLVCSTKFWFKDYSPFQLVFLTYDRLGINMSEKTDAN